MDSPQSPNCHNTLDPFTLEEIQTIFIVRQNGINWCFELLPLAKQVFINPTNPYTRQEFDNETIQRILQKADLLVSSPQVKDAKLDEFKYTNCEKDILTRLNSYVGELEGKSLVTLFDYYKKIEKLADDISKCKVLKYPMPVYKNIHRVLESILDF